MNLTFFKKKVNQTGFTLVEILVSVFILSIALTGIFYVIVFNSNGSALVKNSYIANNLTQEGIEIVRNIRDRDWLLSGVFGASVPDGTWQAQWNSDNLISGSIIPLKYNTSNGLFGYDSGTDTIFTRSINISTVNLAEKRVVVTLSWQEHSGTKTLSAEDHLFNWK